MRQLARGIIPIVLAALIAASVAAILRFEGSIYKTEITKEFALKKTWTSLKYKTIKR
jgi:hypothetical protein